MATIHAQFKQIDLKLGEAFDLSIDLQLQLQKILAISEWQLGTTKWQQELSEDSRNEFKDRLLQIYRNDLAKIIDIDKKTIGHDFYDESSYSIYFAFKERKKYLHCWYKFSSIGSLTQVSNFKLGPIEWLSNIYNIQTITEIYYFIISQINPYIIQFRSNDMYFSAPPKKIFEESGSIVIGWLTYLSNHYFIPDAVFQEFETEIISGKGVLIRTCEEVFDRYNEAHVERATRLWKLINENNDKKLIY